MYNKLSTTPFWSNGSKNNDMQIFNNSEFGEIRTVTVSNEPWFVGVDIARALGYKKPSNAVNDNVDKDDTLKKGVIDAMGREQETIVINESGLYSLIFGSALPSAKRFKKWVTSEVLPSIRKTGSYDAREPKLPTTTSGQIQLLAQGMTEMQEQIDTVSENVTTMRSDFDTFKEDCPCFPVELDKISTAARRKGVSVMGGKQSGAYHDRSIVQLVYRDIYGEIHRNFACGSYKEIPRKYIPRVLEVIENYTLPMTLSDKILEKNSEYLNA